MSQKGFYHLRRDREVLMLSKAQRSTTFRCGRSGPSKGGQVLAEVGERILADTESLSVVDSERMEQSVQTQ